MKCEKCGGESLYIIDSRPGRNEIGTKRRRECADCGHRITTYEITQLEYRKMLEADSVLRKIHSKLDIFLDKEQAKEDEENE